MNPCRDLDTIVAEKVMGWIDIRWSEANHSKERVPQGVKPGTIPSPHTGFVQSHIVPHYSTDIAAAWEIIVKLQYIGWRVAQIYDNEGLNWVCNFMQDSNEFETGETIGETAEHAICLAALKAVGVELP